MINCNGSSFTGAELNLRAVELPCLSLHFGRRGYVDPWNNGSVDNIMSFFDKKELQFANHGWFPAIFRKENIVPCFTLKYTTDSNVGKSTKTLNYDKVKEIFAGTTSDFHDLKLKTRSLHGQKRFTTWEWTIHCNVLKEDDGTVHEKAKAPGHKSVGCTLLWWNKDDKIVKLHEYMQVRDPDEED